MTEPKDLICEIRLLDKAQACLEIDGLMIEGRHSLDESLVDEVRQTQDTRRAGSLLFDALLPEGQPTLEAYRKISTEFRQTGARQSVRLHIAPDADQELHALPWELLYDPRRRIGLGHSQEISFLRTVDTSHPHPEPIEGFMRLLVAVSAPSDVLRHNLPALDRRFEERSLIGALRRLQDLVRLEVMQAPVTVQRLADHLAEGHFHALHLVAHGRKLPHEDTARLLLEDESGRGVWTDNQDLSRIFGSPDLHLVTLMACHDGIETRADPFHGLGPALIRLGAPSVVATRQALTVSQASKVTTHLYRGLALNGRIDEAINEARERLFHSRPERFTWAAPTAFLGGNDAFLWRSEEARRQQVEEDTQSLELAQMRLEQQRREQLAAWVEPPPPPETDHRWRIATAVLSVLTLVFGLGLIGAFGYGPLAFLAEQGPLQIADTAQDLRPTESIDPEATRRALPRYASACDAGNALACARLATIYELGRGVQKNLATAQDLYRRACEGGEPSSCYHLGHLLESPGDGPIDEPAAISFYRTACEGGDLRACRRLTVLKVQSEVPVDLLAESTAGLDGSSRPPAASPEVEESGGGPADGAPADGAPADRAPTDSPPAPPVAEEPVEPSSATAEPTPQARPPRVLIDGQYQEGQIAATHRPVADRTSDGSRWVYEVGGTTDSQPLVGEARGNIYRVFEPTELLEWDVWLDFIDQQDLTFSVHVADADLGSYSSILSRSVTVQGRGADWYSSGEMNLSLETGRYYLVAVSWNGQLTYAFGSGPQRTLFAELTHGHVDLDPILPEVESESADRALYRQRLITSHPIVVNGQEILEPSQEWITALEDDRRISISNEGEPALTFVELGAAADSTDHPPAAARETKGNVLWVDAPVFLSRLGLWLDLLGPTEIELGIYRSPTIDGSFERIFETAWAPSVTGPNWLDSPTIDIELEAGMYYAALASWDSDVGYRFAVTGSAELPFGAIVQGFTASSSGLPGRFSGTTVDRATFQQRWFFRPPGEQDTEPERSSAADASP